MGKAPDRRQFLTAAMGCGAALCAPGLGAFAQGAPALTTETLRGGVKAVRGAGGTVLLAPDVNGVVMVDSGLETYASALMDHVYQETGGGRVRALFNTSWRPKHTGANQTLGEAGTPILAHENTRLWLSHEHWVRWEDKTYAPLPEAALPTETFYEGGAMALGEDEARYAVMPRAHTDGDIYVHFPAANVIATGGVGPADGWPVIDWATGGWLGGYSDALGQIAETIDDETIVVPVSGPLLNKADIVAQQEMYSEILRRMAVSLRASHGFDEMLAANPTEGFAEEWGDPEFFLRQAYRGMWGYIRGDRRVSTI